MEISGKTPEVEVDIVNCENSLSHGFAGRDRERPLSRRVTRIFGSRSRLLLQGNDALVVPRESGCLRDAILNTHGIEPGLEGGQCSIRGSAGDGPLQSRCTISDYFHSAWYRTTS